MASARFLLLRSIACLALAAVAFVTHAQAQGFRDGFDPNGDANIYAMVRQPDGKIIVGGNFTWFEPDRLGTRVSRERIARINRDGTIDSAFTTYTNGDISAIALQPDGRIIIAGKFSIVGSSAGEYARTGVARLNADGSVDPTFVQVNPEGFGYYPQAIIRTVAVQADGRILIGGAFSTLQPEGAPAPIARSRLARLNSDGTVDATFDVAANNTVLALLVQPDGDIVVGGGFTTIRGHGATQAATRGRIARLNSDGTLDEGFVAGFNNRVLALARQADGKIVAAGEFTTIGMPNASAVEANFLARINVDGTHDSGFSPGASAAVESISIQADGRIVIAGRFTWVRSSGSSLLSVLSYVARLHVNGVVDSDFAPTANAPVTASLVQPDGTIVVAGYFTGMNSGSGSSAPRGRIARLLPDGTLDVAFRSSSSGSVLVVESDTNGNLIVGGSYAAIGGATRYNLARVSPAGVVDATFQPEINGSVFAVRILSDGKMLIGGTFTRVGSVSRRYIARLNADGTLDEAFNPAPNATVYAIGLQGDGKILIGGNFTALQPNPNADAVTRRYIARLNADGTVDTGFDPNANLTVNSIAVQSDGKIYIGGDFYTLQPNGARRASSYFYVARLNTDGTPDDTFVPRPNNAVSRVKIQSDGKILISGSFTALTPGRDTTSTTRRNVARLNSDGTLDTGFDPGPNGIVYNIEQYPDGRYLIHGAFTMFQSNGATTWTERPYVAWLNADGSLDTSRVLTPNTTASVTRVLPDGTTYLGGAFNRLTNGAGQVTPATDVLVRLNASGAIDAGFTPTASGLGSAYVGALATQVGGRIYAAGSFSGIAGSRNSNVARFFADGVPDNGFSSRSNGAVHAVVALETSEDEEEEGGPVAWLEPNGDYRSSFNRSGSTEINGTVYALAVQGDGKVVVGGEFSDTSVTTTGNLARLNADGTFDTTFNPEPNAIVNTIAVLGDGRMIVGGAFTTINGATQGYLARVLQNGTLDTSWVPAPNGIVYHVVPLSDGSVLVGGLFTQFRPNGATNAVVRSYVARLKPDGTVDTDFNPEVNGGVNRIIVQADGKYVLGGAFTSVKGKAREFLARVDNRGALDEAFYPKPNNGVERIALLPSGAMVVAGQFTNFEPNDAGTFVTRSLVARVNADGTIDEAFQPLPNNLVEDIAVAADGSFVISGVFTAFQREEGGATVRRNHLARFLANGSLDETFNPNANGTINTVVLQSDNSMLIGGSFNQLRPAAVAIVGGEFTEISESPTRYLARLNDDGSVDSFYAPQPDGPVRALAEQSNGMLIVGGDFGTIAGNERARLARLDGAGGIDPAFTATADGSVRAIAVQADDRIVIGGDFATVGGAPHARLARLLAAGTVDATFSATTDDSVSALAIQPDGRILVAGAFTQVNGTSRPYLARLATDGTLDATFAPDLDAAVQAIAVQADGRILIGGAFTEVEGTAQAHVARLAADGTLDTTFTAQADGAVRALLLMSDGRVVAGGSFSTFAGRRLLMLARIANPTPATQSATLSNDLSTFTWSSGGSSPVFSSVSLATSTDGRTWTNLGDAIRTANGSWQLGGLSNFSATAMNFVRARAVHASAPNGSVGRFESAWAFYGSTPAGPASLLNSGGAAAGWTGGYGDPSDGSGSGNGSGGTGGSPGGGSGSGSGGTGSGSGDGTSSTQREYHLINLSVRAWPADGQPFIAGLVITGEEEGSVLLRGVGPGLERFGVDPVMSEPRMTLFDGKGSMLSRASSWTGDTSVAEAAEAVGAFTLDPASDDSAVVRSLPPGAYTIHLDAGAGLNGIALGEVYYAGEAGGLANFSARAPAGAGTAACIAGFVLGGDQPRRLLIRGVGPALTRFGVSDAVPDTSLSLFNAAGELIAFNDNWQEQSGSTAVEVYTAAVSVGAFTLPVSGKDAAVVVELPPGAYTVHVGGAVAGTVLAEIYEVP